MLRVDFVPNECTAVSHFTLCLIDFTAAVFTQIVVQNCKWIFVCKFWLVQKLSWWWVPDLKSESWCTKYLIGTFEQCCNGFECKAKCSRFSSAMGKFCNGKALWLDRQVVVWRWPSLSQELQFYTASSRWGTETWSKNCFRFQVHLGKKLRIFVQKARTWDRMVCMKLPVWCSELPWRLLRNTGREISRGSSRCAVQWVSRFAWESKWIVIFSAFYQSVPLGIIPLPSIISR